jgi:hypothetical protein
MRGAVLFLCGALALFAQDKAGSVSGIVANSATGAGISGATVRLTTTPPAKDPDHYQTVTDATGSFHFSGVKPGNYSASAQREEYFAPLSFPFNGGGSVHISAGEEAAQVRLELIPPSRLRGRVIGIDGKPAAGVEVAAGSQYALTTKTNEDGYFVLDHLQPGSYGLMALVNHVRTYFPATLDATLAESIPISGGMDQGGIEIRLQTATTHRVKGVVLDAAGRPAPRAVVGFAPAYAQPATGGFSMSSRGTSAMSITSHVAGVPPDKEDPAVTGKDGAFEFPAVLEGDWVFHVESEDLHYGATAVGVRRDIDDLKIRIETPFDLDGSVAPADGSPLPANAAVIVRLVSLDGMPPVTAITSKEIEKGALHFKNVAPGRYFLQASTPPGAYYVASVMAGTQDIAGQPVLLNAGSPPIRVILKSGAAITGTVEKGESATVLLVPQTLAPGDDARMTSCGSGGKFEVAGLAPGDYYAVAVNNADLRSLLSLSDVARIRAILGDATSVRIEEGAVASVQLKAPIPLP